MANLEKIGSALSAISPALGVAGSIGSSIIGAISGRSQIKKSIKAQQEENAENRRYNLMLANLQNEWNQQQWERENAYNTPLEQMKRFKDAGLNPNLIYGQQNLSATSPEMTAGDGSTPTDMSMLGQMPTIGDAVMRGIDNSLKVAQFKNIEANTRKVNSETKGQDFTNEILSSDARFRDAMNQTTLELQSVTIDMNKQLKEVYGTNVEKARVEISNLEQQGKLLVQNVEEARQRIKGLDLDNQIKEIEKAFKSKTFDLEVDNLVARTELSRAEAKAALMNAATNAMLGASQNELNWTQRSKIMSDERLNTYEMQRINAMTDGIKIENGRAQVQLKLDKRYGDAKAIIGMTTDVLDSAARVCSGIGSITSVVSTGQPVTSTKYSRTIYDAQGNPMWNYSERR